MKVLGFRVAGSGVGGCVGAVRGLQRRWSPFRCAGPAVEPSPKP